MKILFITQFYPPELGAAASRISGLARNLKRLGHDVTVLTGFPNYPSGIIHQKYRKKFVVYEEQVGVQIKRVWVYSSPKRKFYTRLLNYFSLVFTSILFEFYDRDEYDVAIASSPPLFLGIAGYVVSRIKRARFTLDVRDLWPKIGVDMGELKKDALFVRLAERLEKFLYYRADIITVTTNLKRKYIIENGIIDSKVTVIPNGVDREYLDLKTDVNVKEHFFNNHTFVVLYAGLIGIAQGVEVIIYAANLLKDRDDIKFYIIGEGVEKEKIIKLVNNLKLQNVIFVESLPKENIATFLRNADVTVIPLKKASFSDAVPSKLLESLAFNCPVVLSASGESETIVEKSGGGLITEPGNAEELSQSILKLYNDIELKMRFKTNNTDYIEINFMREKIAQQLATTLKKD